MVNVVVMAVGGGGGIEGWRVAIEHRKWISGISVSIERCVGRVYMSGGERQGDEGHGGRSYLEIAIRADFRICRHPLTLSLQRRVEMCMD